MLYFYFKSLLLIFEFILIFLQKILNFFHLYYCTYIHYSTYFRFCLALWLRFGLLLNIRFGYGPAAK